MFHWNFFPYLIMLGDWRIISLVDELEYPYSLLLLTMLRWKSIYCTYDEIMNRVCSPSKVINIIVESLFLESILAHIYFFCLVDVASDTKLSGYLHSYHVVFRIYFMVVILFLFFILHDLAVRSFHESEQLMCLLVLKKDPDWLKIEKFGQSFTHILEKLPECALSADFSWEFDALNNLTSRYKSVLIWL